MILWLVGCIVSPSRLDQLLDADGDGVTVGEDCNDADPFIGECPPEPVALGAFGAGVALNEDACLGAVMASGRYDGAEYVALGATNAGDVEVRRVDDLALTATLNGPTEFGGGLGMFGDPGAEAAELVVGRPTNGGVTPPVSFGPSALMCGDCASEVGDAPLVAPEPVELLGVGLWRVGDWRIANARSVDGDVHMLVAQRGSQVRVVRLNEPVPRAGRVLPLVPYDGGVWVGAPGAGSVVRLDAELNEIARVSTDAERFGQALAVVGERLVIGSGETRLVHIDAGLTGDHTLDTLPFGELVDEGAIGRVLESGDLVGGSDVDLVVGTAQTDDGAGTPRLWVVPGPLPSGRLDVVGHEIVLPVQPERCGGARVIVEMVPGGESLLVALPGSAELFRVEANDRTVWPR